VGTSTDGGTLGFQANVMAASANSIAGQFAVVSLDRVYEYE
jgi:hypothetical protein